MSLERLYEAVSFTAEKAYQQPVTQDVLNMAAAALHLANAYQVMKETEIHEKFHTMGEGGLLLPGEGGPINGSNTN
jgi:hypothetical protein